MLRRYLPSYKKLFIGFLAIYLIRLVIVFTMGIMPQDAYYYLYSEHLDFSYFDHPPMVAYMLRAFSLVLGKSVVAIKLTDFIVTLMSLLAFYKLARYFLSEKQAIRASLFYGTTLLLTVLSINTTPDVPLMLFWTLALVCSYKALFEGRLKYWIAAGFLMGLSFISKYTGLFLLFGFFAFLMLSKSHRRYLLSKQSALLLIFFAIGIFPVVYWNYANDWTSFAFQTADRAGSIDEFKLHPELFLGYVATQLMLLIPFLFVGMIVIVFKMIRKVVQKRASPHEKNLFLMVFSLPIILFFFGVSLIYWVKLNWIMPGYIAAIILVSSFLGQKLLRGQIITSLVLHILLAVQIVFYPVSVKSDDTWFGWDTFSATVEERMTEHPNAFLFADDNYKTSAVLDFYLDRKIYAGNVVGRNGKQFAILDPDLSHLEGADAIFIDTDKRFKHVEKSGEIPEKLLPYFNRVVELEPILVGKEGKEPLRKFLVYKCYGYKSKPNEDANQ
jgi:hypothetical protein